MRIGWVSDYPPYVGGAELTQRVLLRDKPEWAEPVTCHPGFPLPTDVDCYVVHNCVDYDATIVNPLSQKPILKMVHDIWPHGDPDVRAFLCATAKLLFLSPDHRDKWFDWPTREGSSDIIPPAVDWKAFASRKTSKGEGACWIGSMLTGDKGVSAAVKWADDHGQPVDFYGFGSWRPRPSEYVRDCGRIDPEKVPEILSKYETLVFLPIGPEPFGRVAAEAFAMDRKLVLNGRVGARYWIEHDPLPLQNASDLFWDHVRQLTDA